MSTQKVFVQFRYCPLCRLNHKKGKKHVHSKRHQEIVANIQAKFLKKISLAKLSLDKPSVQELAWDEANKKFWCYFCQMDVGQHRHHVTTMGECIIQHGGMLEHLTRDDHVENTAKFLKENKIDMKRTPEFIISSQVYLKFLEDTETVCSQFFFKKSQALHKMAEEIRSQALERHGIVVKGLREQSLMQQQKLQQPSYNKGKLPESSRHVSEEERGRKTVQAFGEGLTAIHRNNEDDSAGNIYTNAVPPWMQSDAEEESGPSVVGPTMDDLEKHRKLEKKRQLPANRVGAKFDHKTDRAESWLPSFGGVWSHGRRTNSAQQFHRRQSRKTELGSNSTSSLPLKSPLLVESSSPVRSLSSLSMPSYPSPNIPRITSTITSATPVPNINTRNSANNYWGAENPDVLNSQPTSSSFLHNHVGMLQHQNFSIDQADKSSFEFTSFSGISKSDMNSVDSFEPVIVKPYVSKRRKMMSQDSGHSLESSTPQSYHSDSTNFGLVPGTPFTVLKTPTQSLSLSHYQLVEPVSQSSVSRDEVLNTYSEQHIGQMSAKTSKHNTNHSSSAGGGGSSSYRLLATPVLDPKRK